MADELREAAKAVLAALDEMGELVPSDSCIQHVRWALAATEPESEFMEVPVRPHNGDLKYQKRGEWRMLLCEAESDPDFVGYVWESPDGVRGVRSGPRDLGADYVGGKLVPTKQWQTVAVLFRRPSTGLEEMQDG